MLILSRNGLLFQGEDGETITFTVTASDTAFLVTYVLNGQEQNLAPGDQIEFTLSSADPETVLTLLLGYVPTDGSGSYTVAVKGNRPGFTHTKIYSPRFGVPLLVKPYTFLV